MANTTNKLSDEIHDILVKAFAEGLPKVRAAKRAGIHHNTLNNWLKKGEAAKSGKMRALYEAVEEARSTFWEVKQSELEQVVYKQALKGDTTVSMKFSRVMKLSADDTLFLEEVLERSEEMKERFEQEGILFKQEVTIRQHRPDGNLALEILARRSPEEWGKYETLKLEMDIRKELEAFGLNADDIIASTVKAMEQMIAEKDEEPLAITGESSEE